MQSVGLLDTWTLSRQIFRVAPGRDELGAAGRHCCRGLDRLDLRSYSSCLKKATITETKNKLSALIDQVRHGETVLILDRGRPVARLESVIDLSGDAEGRILRLERRGLVRRAAARSPEEVLDRKPPRPAAGSSAVAALLEERSAGR